MKKYFGNAYKSGLILSLCIIMAFGTAQADANVTPISTERNESLFSTVQDPVKERAKAKKRHEKQQKKLEKQAKKLEKQKKKIQKIDKKISKIRSDLNKQAVKVDRLTADYDRASRITGSEEVKTTRLKVQLDKEILKMSRLENKLRKEQSKLSKALKKI